MSLINDALRKARQAAAEHDMRQPRTDFRAPKAYPSRGPRRTSAVLLILVAVTAGLTGAAVVWWFLGNGDSAVAVMDQPTAAAVYDTAKGPQPGSTEAIEAPPTAGGGTVARPEFRTDRKAAPDQVPVTKTASDAAAAPDDQPAQTPPRAPSPNAGEAVADKSPAVSERVFVLDADLGYASLSLGFIVARPGSPFAEINDIEVVEGSEVAGFVVEKIEANQVTLRDSRGKLVLKVR